MSEPLIFRAVGFPGAQDGDVIVYDPNHPTSRVVLYRNLTHVGRGHLVTGLTMGKLVPDNCTRAQAAKVLFGNTSAPELHPAT